ncbi:MAG: hypothetical protein ACPHID_01405 [Thermoplasmatota archaeon]
MTKSAPILLLVALTLLAAPLASAHGAAPARSIDTRVLEDDDGFFSYDAGAQAGLAASGGHDLLTLDIREASNQTGMPVIWMRLTWQTDATEAATDRIRFNVGGTAHEYFLTASTTAIEAHNFDAAFGPFDVQDGHPKAFDLMLHYATLGVQQGDELSNIEIIGQANDGSTADVAPGTWMTALGESAPYGGDPTASSAPGTYTLQGPADLLRSTDPSQVHLDEGASQNITVTLTNPTDLDQFVLFSVASPGAQVSGPDGVALAAGDVREVEFVVKGLVEGTHNGSLTLWSDLGGYQSVPLDVMVHHAEGHEGHHHDGSEGPHEHTETNTTDDVAAPVEESPGVGFAVLAVGLVAIALIRRK